jgi:hypothetical protein
MSERLHTRHFRPHVRDGTELKIGIDFDRVLHRDFWTSGADVITKRGVFENLPGRCWR